MKILFIIILIPVMQLIAQDSNKSQPKTVEFVSLDKYVGVWYEIAKIPNSFQGSCKKNTSATYSIQKDGKIKVVNRCIE
ncbi:MAG: lipocalin family protein, partial [Ignavibacteria bacterium]|nr:lipocalin family protein [Ignavibacteria bacterium]